MNDKEWIEALQERVITLSDTVNDLHRQRTVLENAIVEKKSEIYILNQEIVNLRAENLKLEQEIKELDKCSEY